MAVRELNDLLENAKRLPDSEFAAFVVDAYPRLADPYVEIAAQMSATWFEESDPASKFVAKTAAPIPQDRLEASARWALQAAGAGGLESRLEGTLQRSVLNGARQTTATNVAATGSRWMRSARPDACAFCRLLATRTTNLYRSRDASVNVVGRSIDLTRSDRRQIAAGLTTRDEALARRAIGGRRPQRGNRKLGSEGYHDHCHCIPVEVRGDVVPELPAYVDDWERVYQKARRQSGSSDPSSILSAWREIDGSA